MLHQAPHIVAPLLFVLPHEPHLRPAWMLRAGLLLYDHLGRRETLAGSFGVDLASTPWGAGLKPKFRKGFVYSDARVDDARLVVFNVMDAHERGADVLVQTRLASAQRQQGGGGPSVARDARHARGPARGRPRERSSTPPGPGSRRCASRSTVSARAENVRHVKGSHIVVPRVHDGRSRVHPAERRQADRVRDPLRRPLFADRHDRRPRRGVRGAANRSRRRSTICSSSRTPTSRARSSATTSSGPTAACARSTTTAPRTRRRSRATTCSSSIPARTAARAAAVDLRRQDHDVPQARRAGARSPRALPAGAQAAMDGARGASGRRPARRRALRVDRGARAPLSRAAGCDRSRARATARNPRGADPGRRARSRPIWASDFGNGLTEAEVDVSRARRMGAHRRRRAVAANQVRDRDDRRRARSASTRS